MSVYSFSTHAAQTENPEEGGLRIQVTSTIGLIPIPNATITIYYETAPDSPIQELTTDSSGQTQVIQLPAPPIAYSLEPGSPRPYAEYIIRVSAPGYETVVVSGSEILPEVTSLQNIQLPPLEVSNGAEEDINIGPHTLYYDYPPKIPEAEIKPMDETGEIVLSRVVIPEYVIVHDGEPDDASAPNYYVRYKDYIKNVASCEIYATWPESAIYANILAIMSFTLNRVYTEWYRNQ
ncbi:MAG: carboxypeptidase regulatory-like domain-containing protein [Lachnospiraceae bacterium]|nr:carboxypeptidase regulatory-like domain-containing protein [Lachnospiraceae bacterium]